MPARPVRTLTIALLAGLLGALLPATAAHAGTVQGGRLDWGIKSSFQSYVTGPVAKGGFKLKSGAATVGGSLFRFHSATGSYDPGTGAFEASYSGGVTFQGHQKPDGVYELDMTVSRPTVKISGGSGTLYVDVASKAKDTGTVSNQSQVPFATLGVGGINMKGGGTPLTLTNIPVTLTSQGAQAFAGYYPAGARLDPLSLSADVKTAPAEQAPQSPSAQPSAPAEASQAPGAFADAAVDWGVRRTFREYVTGSIGQGKWTLAEGAQDGGALFRFPQGKGAYDGQKGTLDAAFAGTVQFTGAHLDLTLGKVGVKVENGKGVLSADVTTAGTTKNAVPLVEFDAKALKAEGALVTLTEAPATLTEGGSQAFNSMYKAGTEMDPVSLAVALDATAKLPALPDLGSTASPSAAPAPVPSAGEPAPAAESGKSSNTGLYVGVAAAVLLLAAAAAALLRKRRQTPAPAAGSASTPPAAASAASEPAPGSAAAAAPVPAQAVGSGEASAPAAGSAVGAPAGAAAPGPAASAASASGAPAAGAAPGSAAAAAPVPAGGAAAAPDAAPASGSASAGPAKASAPASVSVTKPASGSVSASAQPPATAATAEPTSDGAPGSAAESAPSSAAAPAPAAAAEPDAGGAK
ncbi:HtaA domain-containing protein [Streptomyces erythrochromogenes]|uniref:HtaA domain-containing protein n=1 Tax=Streptomyces erythrochromogenes TaxID=285574 RepID=UPI00368288AA